LVLLVSCWIFKCLCGAEPQISKTYINGNADAQKSKPVKLLHVFPALEPKNKLSPGNHQAGANPIFAQCGQAFTDEVKKPLGLLEK